MCDKIVTCAGTITKYDVQLHELWQSITELLVAGILHAVWQKKDRKVTFSDHGWEVTLDQIWCTPNQTKINVAHTHNTCTYTCIYLLCTDNTNSSYKVWFTMTPGHKAAKDAYSGALPGQTLTLALTQDSMLTRAVTSKYIRALPFQKAPQWWHTVTYGLQLHVDAYSKYLCLTWNFFSKLKNLRTLVGMKPHLIWHREHLYTNNLLPTTLHPSG